MQYTGFFSVKNRKTSSKPLRPKLVIQMKGGSNAKPPII